MIRSQLLGPADGLRAGRGPRSSSSCLRFREGARRWARSELFACPTPGAGIPERHVFANVDRNRAAPSQGWLDSELAGSSSHQAGRLGARRPRHSCELIWARATQSRGWREYAADLSGGAGFKIYKRKAGPSSDCAPLGPGIQSAPTRRHARGRDERTGRPLGRHGRARRALARPGRGSRPLAGHYFCLLGPLSRRDLAGPIRRGRRRRRRPQGAKEVKAQTRSLAPTSRLQSKGDKGLRDKRPRCSMGRAWAAECRHWPDWTRSISIALLELSSRSSSTLSRSPRLGKGSAGRQANFRPPKCAIRGDNNGHLHISAAAAAGLSSCELLAHSARSQDSLRAS